MDDPTRPRPARPWPARPWLALYDAGQPHGLTPAHPSMVHAWRDAVRRAPDRTAIAYFDGALTVRELDALSDAFAVALAERGVGRGDRVGVYLQNDPQYVITLLALWKLGAIAVAINPMNRHRELATLLNDSGAGTLVCLEGLYADVAAEVVPGTGVTRVITTSELDHQTRDDPRLLGGVERHRAPGTEDLAELLAAYEGRRPPEIAVDGDDVAVLTYTSGTTGPPKGAMNTHRNLVFNAQSYREWIGVGEDDVVLGVAPLFHITGLIGHIALAMINPCTLVLTHRFEPAAVADAVREHRATFTVGAITVFIALFNAPEVTREHLGTLTKIYSGGAPIPPSTVEAFEDRFGHYIHNIYGLTETTSPALGVPLRARAPVDAATGALAAGVPIYDTLVQIVGPDGAPLPPGEIGELVIEGPQVVPGYWRKPEETEHALPGGRLHTGDVGHMDADGWFYLVDRKKDQINAAGYKVWPREVEDVLYEHPAVREAAVIGVPDPYRGETVKAFVSLKPGSTAAEPELIAFAKDRLAAYKYPRSVEIIEELPKTVTGKILRRELRDRDPR